MSNQLHPHELALITNDLSKLDQQERLTLYNKTCESLSLNPLTQPLGFIEFRSGKLSLYAKKDTTDQLRKIHGVSIEITSKEIVNDIYIVCAKATDKTGRVDEDMGTVSIVGLKGEALANAYLKAITKSKRRVTLSICGLGLLDETEVETIPDAKIKDTHQVQEQIQVKLQESQKLELTTKSEQIKRPDSVRIPVITKNEFLCTKEQLDEMKSWMKVYSVTNEDIKDAMIDLFNCPSSRELKSEQAKLLIEMLKSCRIPEDFKIEILAYKDWLKEGK